MKFNEKKTQKSINYGFCLMKLNKKIIIFKKEIVIFTKLKKYKILRIFNDKKLVL